MLQLPVHIILHSFQMIPGAHKIEGSYRMALFGQLFDDFGDSAGIAAGG
jgi:hypothetical protein